MRPIDCLLLCLALSVLGRSAAAQAPDLAEFFGFDPLEVVKIDPGAGPVAVADLDGDGLDDLLVVNNAKSRIELHYQRADAKPEDALTRETDVNELPEHWRFRREFISVSHRVAAFVDHDFDGDGLRDLIYAGSPPEIVFVRQSAPGVFNVERKHTVKDLSANPNGFTVADVIGDQKPELLSLVKGDIHIWPLDGASIDKPIKLGAGSAIIALFVEDFNGDGRSDLAGVIPEDAAPVRLWLGGVDEGAGVLGAQVRFEMPALSEFEPVRLPGEAGALIAVIERASKRLVVSRVSTEAVAESGDRDAALRVFSFTDPANRSRSTAVADADGDGLLDFLATDTEANAVVVYRQLEGKGLQPGVAHPSFAELGYLVVGNVDHDPQAELFVLSEKEGVAGRADVTAEGVPFPSPLSVSKGRTPVALNLVELESGPHVAVVAKETREFSLDLIDMQGGVKTISLGAQSRSPQTILALDADQDGRTDLLLFTPEKPMMMLHAGAEDFKLTESKDMGQFGLVQAATADNTAVFDIDGDGKKELLVADRNFVRAVRYELEPGSGISPGWQVVDQINADDSSSKLVSLVVLEGDSGTTHRIVAADRENSRLIVMARGGSEWEEVESVNVRGFSFNSIYAGAFSGDGQANIMAVGADGFAVVKLAGERVVLDEVAAWRTDKEKRQQHELESGDVNGDGYTDLLSLDAGEQMCEIFSFSEVQRMLYASGFQVFESKMFSGGEQREFEPRQMIIADITSDQADDLILLSHDRVLIYPQMTYSEKPASN